MSRFGSLTKSTGKLRISSNTIIQHNVSMVDNLPPIGPNDVLGKHRKDSSKSFNNFEDVLDAYEKAKQRLMATTINTEPNSTSEIKHEMFN